MNKKQQELQWQAESDASTMANYQEIIGDKARMQRAVKVAKQRAADLTKRAGAMQSVAQAQTNSFARGGKGANGRSTSGRRKK